MYLDTYAPLTRINKYQLKFKRMQFLISIKTVAWSTLTVINFDNGDTITNPCDIANTCNNYFGSIAETAKKEKKKKVYHIHISIFQALEYN